MANFTIKTHFESPLEVTFELISDFEHAAEHIHAIRQLEVLTPGPVGVGTRFRETHKMFGKESSEEMEVTTFNAPHGYTVECDSCGSHCRPSTN